MVAVSWEDAFVDNDPHNSKSYINNYRPCIRKTCGFFLHLDTRGIFITETDDRQGCITGTDCEQITTIPLRMIRTVQVGDDLLYPEQLLQLVPRKKPQIQILHDD